MELDSAESFMSSSWGNVCLGSEGEDLSTHHGTHYRYYSKSSEKPMDGFQPGSDIIFV